MKLLLLFVVSVYFVALANAHGYFSSISVDGKDYPEPSCIRPHPSSKYDYPISSIDNPAGLQSADMLCGWLPNAAKAAKTKCAVNPGSTLTVQFHYEMGMGSSDTFYIDPSHKGPCIVYMARSDTGAGAVWFKIFEDGYDTASKKFCVDKLRANGGKFSFTMPTDIAPGNYLLRLELIALHEGFELGGAQPYVSCAEITLGGSGTVIPSTNLVAFPGAYQASDKGLLFDIYPVKGAYPVPGPPVYISGSQPTNSGSGSGSTTTTTRPASTTTTTKAASTTTTRPASTTTTRPASTTTTRPASTTTAKTASTTTTGRPSTSTTTTTGTPPTPTPTPEGTCNLGEERCASTNTYISCYRVTSTQTAWSAPRSCQAGLVCKPWLDSTHVICDRP